MDVTIQHKEEKPLLKRTDYTARVAYEGATPQRQALRDKIASAVKAPADHVAVRRVTTEFGNQAALVEASVYADAASLETFEPRHIKKRHGLAVPETAKKAKKKK